MIIDMIKWYLPFLSGIQNLKQNPDGLVVLLTTVMLYVLYKIIFSRLAPPKS